MQDLHAAQRLQRLDHRTPAPVLELGKDCLLQTLKAPPTRP
jgi:hypothetical protein